MPSNDLRLFLEHLEKYRFIAHRLGFMMEGYPENSLNNLIALFNDKEALDMCAGIELDVHPTSDHILLVTHDFNTADISENSVSISKTPYEEIKKIKCGYRKSTYNSDIPWDDNNNFHLYTLDEILQFLDDNRSKLGNKIIKIESKAIFCKYDDLVALNECIKRYPKLKNNIVHISFFPWNLEGLRKIQLQNNDHITKTELLIDFNIEKPITIIWKPYIDGISLGLKEGKYDGILDINKEAKRVASINSFFCRHRNAISENWLRKIISVYGYAGIYTINTIEDIEELLSRVSPEFLAEYADKLMITSDNPKYFRKVLTKN